jgi:alpha-glucosidase (family GH31 glycosyl hydrolase)
MVLEYPKDSVTWSKKTQYQFMNGEWLLVAPVYKSENKRDSIYLPKGDWYDYWNGEKIAGGTWLNNYPAPLEKLPLFVKQGAIIPMYPAMNYDSEKKTDTLTLAIYPYQKSTFDLYEDDGLTRQYKTGAFSKTLIAVDAGHDVSIDINAARGDYNGMNKERVYLLDIHQTTVPKMVSVNNKKLKAFKTRQQFDKAKTGYYFDQNDKAGTVHIKTNYLSTLVKQTLTLSNP